MVVMVAAEAGAQRERRGGRGGRPAWGSPPGGADVTRLLTIEAVRKEINLTEAQFVEVRDALGSWRDDERPAGGRVRLRELPPEERPQAMADMRQEAVERARRQKARLAEFLSPEQLERLEQISLQAQGGFALTRDEVAAKLNLTDEQRQEITAQIRQLRREMGGQLRQLMQSGDRNAAREKVREARQRVEEKGLSVLTPEQKQQLKQLQGEPFDMPENGWWGPGERRQGPRQRPGGPRRNRRRGEPPSSPPGE
jgi:hypothetical protein